MMLLSNLTKNITYKLLQGHLNKQIQSITYDSREVKKNSLFIAISGFTVDGHNYALQAIEKGATALIVEKELAIEIPDQITVLKVASTRKALASISASYYNHPSQKLNVIGITGTNGKTSISYFLKSIYEKANQSVGIIGTIGLHVNDQIIREKTSTPTTPESVDLQKILDSMVNMHVDTCIMEVSSHALQLSRVDQTIFQTGIFTNLSADHLEMHKTMDNYFLAKSELFTKTNQFNIVNIDDPYGKKLIDLCRKNQAKTLTYGIHQKADIKALNIQYTLKGTTFTVQTPKEQYKVFVHLPGEIYVYNSLAAIATAYANNIPTRTIQEGISSVENIDGRFEIVYEKEDFKVIIDFAHTEEALKQALQTLRPFVKGRLILVFGVYADMSKSGQMKRRNMGKVAAQFADYSVVTLDNPKYFDQNQIMKEITEAIQQNNGKYEAIFDRKQAIETAIRLSNQNDIILITGKGHETSQNIQGKEIPINEKEIALHALTEKVI